MALWQLRVVGDRVTLTFFHSLRPDGMVQKCGEIEKCAEAELEAWTCDQAAPWDVVTLTSGTSVVRQAAPTGGGRA